MCLLLMYILYMVLLFIYDPFPFIIYKNLYQISFLHNLVHKIMKAIPILLWIFKNLQIPMAIYLDLIIMQMYYLYLMIIYIFHMYICDL